MRAGAFAFLLGDLALIALPELPAWPALLGLCLLALLVCRQPRLRPGAAAILGFCWAALHAHLVLDAALPAELEGDTVVVEGRVAGIPRFDGRRQRFLLDVERLHGLRRPWPFRARIRLDWYVPGQRVGPGERWRLSVRLKRPHGLRNPGGFDYEAWLFRERIRATGYVLASSYDAKLAESAPLQLARLRAGIADRIGAVLGDAPQLGLVTALVIGIRDRIGPEQWDVLRRTGTTHLVAISGLHVGIVAGFVYLLGRWLWSLSGYGVLLLPAPRFAAFVALGSAGLYSALAGFAVPTQRAFIMVGAALLDRLIDRPISIGDRVAIAVVLLLLIDPFVAMAAGYWLSFGAVAAILYVLGGRLRRVSQLRALLLINAVTALALAPLLMYCFGGASLVAPLANLIGVPVLGGIVVPLVLLSTGCLYLDAGLGAAGLQLAERIVELLWALLAALARSDLSYVDRGVSSAGALLCACCGMVILLAPRGCPGRWLAALWLLPVLWWPSVRPREGDFSMTVLDVGQGLAVAVQTHAHALLYDAGPRYGRRFDAGASVVVPYLRQAGVERIDTVVLSHGDLDHAGGFAAISTRMPVARLLSSAALTETTGPGERCHAGLAWEWDQVAFTILHPGVRSRLQGNDRSCVLKVSGRHFSALLAGDIEAPGEHALVAAHGPALAADVLLAPHHGSRTSSTPALLEAVDPEIVVISAGHGNRFGFPHRQVIDRYAARGARIMFTAEHGAVRMSFGASGLSVSGYRDAARRLWHDR